MNLFRNLFGKKRKSTTLSGLSNPTDLYEAIGNELVEIISEPWTRIEIEAKRFEASINLKVVYFRPDGSRESNVNHIMLAEYFFDLAEAVSTKEKGLYKICNFIMINDGTFEVNFQYPEGTV